MQVTIVLVVGCVAAVTIGRFCGADEAEPNNLTAQAVLVRMAKAYADCKSYRDTGVVKTEFVSASGRMMEEKPFKTALVRPDRFRFEYTESPAGRVLRYIVWRKGKDVQTWWDVRPGIEKLESLSLALAGATGVSSGAAHTIPALLLGNEVGGLKLSDLKAANRIEDAKLEEVECFRVEGEHGGAPTTLWIDKATFLVRRIDSETEFDDFRTEETTTYHPIINDEIPKEMLEFDPPKE